MARLHRTSRHRHAGQQHFPALARAGLGEAVANAGLHLATDRLDVDGLAGPQTQIIINSLLAVDGTPRLSTATTATTAKD